jgi:hypothetical protein
MKTPLVVDFRNIYLTGEMARAGFTYISLGRARVTAGNDVAKQAVSPAIDVAAPQWSSRARPMIDRGEMR